MTGVDPDRCRRSFTLWIVFALGVSASDRPAVAPEDVRAGFLYQLAQFVRWPEDQLQGDRLRFCILGNDVLAAKVARTVEGKTIEGREIRVQPVKTLSEADGCHLLFLDALVLRGRKRILSGWGYPPVLVVGEAVGFAESGGLVNLVLGDGKVAFEVNRAAAARARIEFRSQLLRFARLVEDRWGVER